MATAATISVPFARGLPGTLIAPLVEAGIECVRIVAEEGRERERIRAHRDAVVNAIESETAVLRDYIDRTFEERRAILEAHFHLVDVAIANKDNPLLELAYAGIHIGLVRSDAVLRAARE